MFDASDESDFKHLIDWAKQSTTLRKYPVFCILQRWYSDATVGPSATLEGPNKVDIQFFYTGEVDYLRQPSAPGKFFPTESFQGTVLEYPYPNYPIVWKVNIVLVFKPVSMGLWFIGGPYDGLPWDPIVNFSIIPGNDPNNVVGVRFTVPKQTSHEEYRLFLFRVDPRPPLPSGPGILSGVGLYH